jgi:hypothetical protein
MVVRPPSGPALGQAEIEAALTEPFAYISDYTKKKIRNLEKRKAKLEGYKEKLKQGDQLTKDQQIAVNKYDEVNGMLIFANEIITHVSQVEVVLKKEKKKRIRREQIKSEADQLQNLTRQIELYTLMHLAAADDLVGPLREECSFLPSPGASLNQFASGTAKHLISLTDPQDKADPVNYHQIREKLEEIEPSFNPVPYYDEEGYEIDAKEEEVDGIEEDEGVTANETDEITPGDDTPGATETTLDVSGENVAEIEEELNGHDELNESLDKEITKNSPSSPDIIPEPSPVESEPNAISETLEFVNRHVLYKEEDQIKEILVDVSSQFNFMAPAAADDDDDAVPVDDAIDDPRLSFIPSIAAVDGTGEEEQDTDTLLAQGEFVNSNIQQYEHQLHERRAEAAMNLENNGVQPIGTQLDMNQDPVDKSYEDSVKDELNWQQKQPHSVNSTQRQGGYRGGERSSYKNSQRYQRQFNGTRQNGSGDHNERGNNSRGHNGYGNGGGVRRYDRGGRHNKE